MVKLKTTDTEASVRSVLRFDEASVIAALKYYAEKLGFEFEPCAKEGLVVAHSVVFPFKSCDGKTHLVYDKIGPPARLVPPVLLRKETNDAKIEES